MIATALLFFALQNAGSAPAQKPASTPAQSSPAQTTPAQSPATNAAKGCIPFTDASKQVGETVCITGKVVAVNESARSGTIFLNFCEDYKNCPFTVVVFPKDRDKVGDVKKLEGQTIQIHGKVQEYHGQAEIILEDPQQLKGPIAKAPLPPNKYGAEKPGSYSAGDPYAPKKTTPAKPATTITQPAPTGPGS